MAWTASKVFAFSVADVLANAVKPSTDAYKVALYGNTITPDQTVNTAALTEYNGTSSQWLTAGETSGTGYTAGGQWMSNTPNAAGGTNNTSVAQSSGNVNFNTSANPQWTSASFTTYGCLIYNYTNLSKGFCYNWFGGQQTVTAGTFTIAWSGGTIAQFQC